MNVSLPRLLVVLLALATPAFPQSSDLPTTGLESRIEFWKKVFTQYSTNDVAIHDRFHVNLVYDVADDSNVDSKTRAIEQALKEIRANLETRENLGPLASEVYDAVVAYGLTPSAALLDELEDGIHTQRGIKERFREGIIRSGRYVDAFRGIMASEGIPEQIALLPLIESSFENARSKAGAIGLWQFTRGTGRLYLQIGKKGDDRLDPTKATRGAARLLHDNYRALGNWPLAITAYNHGRGGMLRAREEHGSEITTIINEYRGPVFGYASMNFYAEFLAAVDVYTNYPQYFGEIALDKPLSKPSAPNTAVVQTAAKEPAPKTTAPRVTPVRARNTRATADTYKVRSGDTLWDIAQRFGTSIRELMAKNNLSKPAIYAGQILLVK
jgi:membrane-bound lytic murein transglycosylase D